MAASNWLMVAGYWLMVVSRKGIMIKSYKDLEIWQIGMVLTKEIYKITRQLPNEERFMGYQRK